MNPSIIKDIQNAYQEVYYSDEHLFEDIVNFCDAKEIFETIEETEYFANLIIENDLALTFVEDVLEYYTEEQLLDESYITEVSAGLLKAGLKAAGGILKKATPAVRGLPAKTLVKKGYTPGGLSGTGKQLAKVNKPALATQTRAIQQARAARKPPEPPKANRYADMLAKKKAASPAPAAPKPAAPKAGGMTPSYVAKRGVTDTLATTLALGMGHMAGLKPATNILRQMATPIVRSAGSVAQRTAPTVSRVTRKGSASDPWKQFPKTSGKPNQLGLPKEGPSSRLPNRTLPGAPTPRALPAAGQTTAKAPKPTFKPEALPKPPKTAEPGGALVSTRAPKKTGLSPEGQAIQRLNRMTGGGLMGTREVSSTPRAPKPAWGSGSTSGQTQTAGSVQRSVLPATSKPSPQGKKPSGTRPTPSGGRTGSGLTHTVRATLSPTEKTGNMKYPGLEKYATGSGPGSGGKSPKKSSTGRIAAAAGTAATAAAIADSEKEQRKQQKETERQQKALVSNIETSKKKVTGEDVRKSFDTAFATERGLKGSKGTFRWTNPKTGKSGTYTTKMKTEESLDNFDLVLDALLTEGYSSQEALEIMVNLDEAAITKLLLRLQKALPTLSDKGKKLARSIISKQTGTGADLERQKMDPVHRQQTKQRQERRPDDKYGHPSLSAQERNPTLR